MAVALYADVHVRRAVVEGLRRHQVDIITAQDDGTTTLADPLLLDRATALNRVIFSQDADFLREAERRQQAGESFGGVIYAHQLIVSIKTCIEDLTLVAQASDLNEWLDRVEYLPLK